MAPRYRIAATFLCALAFPALTTATARAGWSRPYEVPGLTASVDGLACPTASLCLAISSNELFWSTDPAVRSSWHHKALEPLTSPNVEGSTIGLTGLACASVSYCIAVDNIGNEFTSTDPTGGVSAWQPATIDDDTVAELGGVGCAEDDTCAALAYTGDAFSSEAAGPWSRASLFDTPEGADFYATTCGAAGATAGAAAVCAAVDAGDRIGYTVDPGAAGTAWRSVRFARSYEFDGVDCPTASLCIAVGGYDKADQLAVSGRPAAGVWSALTTASAGDGFDAVACHGSSLCLAIGNDDAYSTRPAARASAWHATSIRGMGSQTAVSCPSSSLCYVGSSTNQIAVGRFP